MTQTPHVAHRSNVAGPANKLADATHMGAVILDVRNLENMTTFYRFVIGLDVLAEGDGRVVLGRAASSRPVVAGQETSGQATSGQIAPGQAVSRQATASWLNRSGLPAGQQSDPLARTVSTAGTPLVGEVAVVVLRENRSLPLRAEGSAGLFHTAILFQNPRELAAAIIRIARHTPELFTGTGDHDVSQAFYLDDPEGNGVELYIDRPRDQWKWVDGQVHMTTEYIDPNQFIAEHMPGVSEQTREGGNNMTLGHVHLQVGDVASAHEFYVRTLGFEVTARMGSSALFVSAGGYHHHMAMNTWGSGGAGMRAPSLGLGRVDVLVPSRVEVESAADRLAHAGFAVRDDGRTVETPDPWGNLVRLTADEGGTTSFAATQR